MVTSPLSEPDLMLWSRYSKADWVEWPLRQPNWFVLIIFCSSRNWVIWDVRMESKILPRWGKLEIGLVSLKLLGLGTLSRGITWANFHASGYVLEQMARLKMSVRYGQIVSINLLIYCKGRLSGLIRFDEVTDFSRRDLTCSGVTWEKVNKGYKGLLGKRKILFSSLVEQAGWDEDTVMK